MPSINGNIRVTYEIDDLEELLSEHNPDETTIEKVVNKDEIVFSRHWTITHDQLVEDARNQLAENHPTLKLDVPDAEVVIEDETVIVTFLVV